MRSITLDETEAEEQEEKEKPDMFCYCSMIDLINEIEKK
jgi:hypothetical protein